MMNIRNSLVILLLGAMLCSSSWHRDPEIPSALTRKYKRDAARLALRLQLQEENLRLSPVQIAAGNREKIFKSLCQIYQQTEQGKRMELCNIHTFPDPSIDHMVIIYQKNEEWATPLANGQLQTNSQGINHLLETHKLALEKHVQWNEQQNAITLRAKEPLNMAALAQDFMKISGVKDCDLGIPKVKGNDIVVRRGNDGWDFEFILRFGAWSAGKGEAHHWMFQVTDKGVAKYIGDSGQQIPTWLKCDLERINGVSL